MDSAEISEWMAFDRLKDDDYKEKLELSMMNEQQRNARIMKMFGGKHGNN